MRYSILMLFVIAIAAGCAPRASQSDLQAKCAAGDEASCTEIAKANRAREMQSMRTPIPSPAVAIGAAH